MRKMMQREVTQTKVKVAEMVVENGLPVAKPLEDIILLGNVSQEKAQKHVSKELGKNATVFGVEPETLVYEMEVSEFIKIATPKEVSDEVQDELELV